MILDLDHDAISIDKLTKSSNCAEYLDDVTRERITTAVMDGYVNDKQSREKWELLNANALAMATQVPKDKTEPWVGASNVKFPLIAVASVHYHARAYPLLVDDADLVKCMVYGDDPDGKKSQQAERVAQHMTWQCFEEIEEWEEEVDKLILIKAILGVVYLKQWYSPELRRQRVMCVSPADFIVNYWTRGDVNSCPRATHKMEFQSNDVHAKVARGVWLGYDEKGQNAFTFRAAQPENSGLMVQVRDKRTGIMPPQTDGVTPSTILEQMTWIDLDGDGFCEPYFVTVETDGDGRSGKLRRIVARYTKGDITRVDPKDATSKIIDIKPERSITKWELLPAPDGSHMGIGFGRLLGPLNASVDSALNSMFDSATMSNYGGGFIGRGARFKGGTYKFVPGEWKQVDVPGNDLKNNVVPAPTPQPSEMMFQLIGFLVNYGERLASAGDVQMGENVGQNTKAGTMQTMNENGQRAFKGMYKRAWRAMRNCFRVQYDLSAVYLEESQHFYEIATGKRALVQVDDYRGNMTVRPAADPNVVSPQEQQQQAQAALQLSQQFPHNRYQLLKRILKSVRFPAPDEVFPPPKEGEDYPVPPSVEQQKIEIDKGYLEIEKNKFQVDAQDIMKRLDKDLKMFEAEFFKEISGAVENLAQAKAAGEGNMVGMLQVAVSAYKERMSGVVSTVDQLLKGLGGSNDAAGKGSSGGTSKEAGASGMGAASGNKAPAPTTIQ